ncbi:sodium:proton antiporter [uncultured Desulfobacter sp.]|uniref:cation:proton antiporter n=1 Tax=uncultured Desulfobacter sp. TaxID=240139 RepID=UPI002AAB9093|nr:sodium:proton antiporter [uncultured Desulfobacter sp.]
MNEDTLIQVAGILVAAAACQWLAWRVKIPGIVFLLVTGIMAGPVLGVLNPEKMMGDLFFPFVSMSVALILFEGSLTLDFAQIRGLHTVVRNMVSYGMLVTWIITALAARLGVGLSWQISVLLGAITSVSGPTVIVPMLRTVRPNQNIANILRWEGIIVDPIGAAMAVLAYEFIISGSARQALGHTMLVFIRLVATGTAIGAVCGYGFGMAIRKHWIPEFMHNLFAFSLVLGAFAFSNHLQHESGLVTVTVMGIWLANMKDVGIEDILDFEEHISILLISVLFIILAARLNIDELIALGWGMSFLFIAIQFLARPMNIMVSSIGSSLTWPERHMLAWIAPRGIVAAAISALFATQLQKAGYPDAGVLVPLTFFIIISTVMVQSVTARPLARWLKVAEPTPNGFIIIGANQLARGIGKALMALGFQVQLADTGWDQVIRAKNEGLPTYFGNPVSEHADRHIQLVGVRGVLAMFPHEAVNVAAAIHYRLEFGTDKIYILHSRLEIDRSTADRMSIENHGRILFGKTASYPALATDLSRGGQIIITKLTEKFTLAQFIGKHGQKALLLFAVDKINRLYVYAHDSQINPEPGWSLVYLLKNGEGSH